MIVGILLMVLLLYGAISLAGASIGIALRRALPAHLRGRTWNLLAIVLVVVVGIAHILFQTNARHEAKNEASSVVNFVKTNKEVLSKAGSIRAVIIDMGPSIKKDGSIAEYDLYVNGDKAVFPVVRVMRDFSPPQVVLACVSEIPSGKRDVYKDPCEQ